MKQIINRLYVGDQGDSIKALENKDYAVVSMTKEGPTGHRAMLKYESLGAPKDDNYYYAIRGRHFAANLIDVNNEDFIPEEVIFPALDFIKEHYDKGEKVLIHCEMGRSRGPTTTLLFLRSIGEMPYSFKIAEKIFKTIYPKYDPGNGVRQFAKDHWKEIGQENDKSDDKPYESDSST